MYSVLRHRGMMMGGGRMSFPSFSGKRFDALIATAMDYFALLLGKGSGFERAVRASILTVSSSVL